MAHIVLFPFLAQGHLNPFLSLADLLLRRRPSLTVTLVSTPRNIAALRSSLAPDSPLRLHSLPFSPSSHGLPPQAESLAAIPVRQFITFFRASESLRPAFDDFIAGTRDSSPLCVVSDYFFGWSADVARKHGAFHSVFLTNSAFGTAAYFSLWTHLPHALTSADEFPLPDLPDVVVHRSQLSKYVLAADGTDPLSRFFRAQISFCRTTDAVLVNTVEEIEAAAAAAGLRMLRRTLNDAPVFPVGPLLSSSAPEFPSSSASSEIVEWLDAHPRGSVIYVSFGSQNTIQAAQMMELAMGLEASGRPFIWVVRPPVGFDVTAEFDAEWLPEGFEEATRKEKRGLVIRGWAPQVTILRHGSTGAFLSHCGWNSMLESLIHGVPIIGWPLTGDQFFNATMAAELGVCVEAARGNMESSRVERGRVAEVVGAVMGEASGKEMRRRAAEIRAVMEAAWREGIGPPGSSAKGMEEFFEVAGVR